MARHRHTEEEDWWPDALAMFAELAAEGMTKNAACNEVADHFPCSANAFQYVAARGSIPSYPATDQARAKAWLAGEVTFDGKLCRKHKTRVRYSNDGSCVECQREYKATLIARRQNKAPQPPASID